MAWFEKKEKKGADEIPSLPELPRLPELPKLGDSYGMNFPKMDDSKNANPVDLPHLPSYPNNSFGKKFSQNAIKDAVSGEEEEEEGEADEFPDEEEMTPKPLPVFAKKSAVPSDEYQRPMGIMKPRKPEPVFIRIDKFEAGLGMLEDARKKLGEMEEMLKSIKKTREEEDKEIRQWENDIQSINGDFEKINQDLFSRV